MKKLKIAIVVRKFPTVTETFIVNQIVYLIDQGHEVFIYSIATSNINKIHESIKNYGLINKTIYIPPIPKKKIKRVKIIISNILKDFSIRKLIEFLLCLNYFKVGRLSLTLYIPYYYCYFKDLNDYDLVHAHYGSCGVMVSFFKKLGLLKRTKLITSFHGHDISPDKTNYYKNEYRHVFKYTQILTVNSSYSFSLLEKIKGDRQNIKILPVGLDTKKFQNFSNRPKNGKITILFCGRLIRLKGAHLTIFIANALREQINVDFQLLIIGDGPDQPYLHNLIREFNMESIVSLMGNMTQEEIINYLCICDVFLFPGIHDPKSQRCETQGLVVQEAQSMEIPVVVSNVGGIKYGMIDGVTGIEIKEGDIDGFVKALKELIFSPILREEMGKSGRKFVVNNFDYNVLGKELENIYYNAFIK